MSEGQIIVLEGIDKAGKGTQCRLLHNAIRKAGMDCIILDFPVHKPSGYLFSAQ